MRREKGSRQKSASSTLLGCEESLLKSPNWEQRDRHTPPYLRTTEHASHTSTEMGDGLHRSNIPLFPSCLSSNASPLIWSRFSRKTFHHLDHDQGCENDGGVRIQRRPPLKPANPKEAFSCIKWDRIQNPNSQPALATGRPF